jgi:acetyl-CoA carboxylase biotin carboxyl carrier protein
MRRRVIDALVEVRGEGESFVLAPTVGSFRCDRLVGEILKPGSLLGVLTQHEVPFDLRLPEGASGELREVMTSNRWDTCAYARPLLRLVLPRSLEETEAAEAARHAASGDSGLFGVSSPTHGTFYRKPSPDTPAYVDVGDEVCRGETLGLVEVMKCFSPITFDPPAGHQKGVVREIHAHDGTEVRSEQVLLKIELR